VGYGSILGAGPQASQRPARGLSAVFLTLIKRAGRATAIAPGGQFGVGAGAQSASASPASTLRRNASPCSGFA
jgi:hypothetical protein